MKSIGIVIFPFFCLLLSFFVLLSDPGFTYLLLDNPAAVQPTKQLLDYFANQAPIPLIFNDTEKAHLQDVKQIIQTAFFAMIIFAILLFFIKNYGTVIGTGGKLLLALIAIGALIPFDTLFVKFHELFFAKGTWLFPPDSTLIQFYPFAFFKAYAIAIAIHAVLIAVFLFYFEIVSSRG